MKKLYKNDRGEWALYPYHVKYTHDGIQQEQLADNPEWYRVFAEQWADYVIDDILPIVYDENQNERLKEIQGMPSENYDELSEYVLNGNTDAKSKIFIVKKVIELGENMTETELALVEIYEVLGV